MTDNVAEQLWTRAKRTLGPLSALPIVLNAAGPPLLFGFRMVARLLFDLTKRVALVPGSSRGIGHAIAASLPMRVLTSY